MSTETKTYSIEQACKVLNFSRQTIYEEINSGRLKTYKVGTRRFVSVGAIDTYIKDRELETA